MTGKWSYNEQSHSLEYNDQPHFKLINSDKTASSSSSIQREQVELGNRVATVLTEAEIQPTSELQKFAASASGSSSR